MADRVVYFAGCFARYYAPETAHALVHVLETNGIEVLVPEQRCCGMPLMANGNDRGARRNFDRNAESLARAARDGAAIVTTCPSCNLMLRREGLAFFPGDDARFVAQRVRDAGEYLAALHEAGRLKAEFGALPGRAFYHNPCHLKVQNIAAQPLRLLRLVPELEVVAVHTHCCGMGGSYGMKKQNYDRSVAVAREVWREVEAARADVVTTECGGCGLQIQAGTGKECMHSVVLLSRAYEAGAGRSGTAGSRAEPESSSSSKEG